MNRLFIEAKREKTSECYFLKALIARFFPDKDVTFVCMDGVSNLFNETNQNLMRQAQEEGDSIIVFLDADTIAKGWGYANRSKDVEDQMRQCQIYFPYFLYPNNADDGDVETLMESLAQKELHKEWWDCFGDYETCVDGAQDESGHKRYNLPNRKAKLHTYISSQQLNKRQRDKLGSGDWLFDNSLYWDLTRLKSHPIIDFLRKYLQ